MSKKILIVEDDQIVANIYRNKFSVEGYKVEVALDGQSGLEMLNSFRPDAVVLDLMLPKMTGVDFMKQVRAQQDFQQLPVIVFSNTYLTNMVQEAWKAGATKCLSKANCTAQTSDGGAPHHHEHEQSWRQQWLADFIHPQTASPSSFIGLSRGKSRR